MYPTEAMDACYSLRNFESGFCRRYRVLEDGNLPGYGSHGTALVAQLTSAHFLGLDDLSHQLQEEGIYGYGVIFLLIWITTFRKR